MQKTVVIVPTYNNPKTIKAVAKDLQEHKYEIIIVDDGSDESIELMFSNDEKKNILTGIYDKIFEDYSYNLLVLQYDYYKEDDEEK